MTQRGGGGGREGEPRARFVVGGASGVHANLALEEAMLDSNRGLTVRVWTNERSVVIGRAQLARFETDLDYCESRGIPVVRRVTAGGTVYHGPGNVNWSLFVGSEVSKSTGEGRLGYVWGVNEVFGMGAALVTDATARCGVRTWLEGVNRILSDEGKVSGMAAYLRRDGLLCHGTLLLSADLEEAKRVSEPKRVSLERRYTRSRPMKMANTGIGLDSFIDAMKDAATERAGRELEDDQPNEEEVRARDALLEKYRDPEWNLGDPFERETSPRSGGAPEG